MMFDINDLTKEQLIRILINLQNQIFDLQDRVAYIEDESDYI